MSASNFEPPPPNLVHRPSTFTAKFRRRRKEEASISTFTLFIFVITTTTLITPSHCLPFISSSQDDHHGTGAGGIGGIGGGGDCEMVSCFGGSSGGGGEQPNLISMSCPALKALHQCLKTLKCNGNLQYHTFQWMVRNSKRRCRSGGSGNGNGGNGRGDHPKPDQSHHSPPHHHHHHSSRSNRKQSRTSSPSPSPSSSSSTPSLLRSGDASFASFQQQLITNGKGQGRHSPHPLSVLSPVPATSQHSQTYSSSSSSSSSSLSSPSSSTSSSISPPWKTVSEQYCLSAAYNFTIGEPVLDSAHFAAVASRSSAVAVANPEEHQQQSLLLLQQQVIRGAHLRMAAKEEKEEEESSLGKRRRRLQRRDTSAKSGESARIDAEMRKRLGDAFKDYFRGQSQQQQQQQHSNSQSKPSSSSSSESFIQDHLPQQQQSTAAAAARAYRDISGSSGSNIQQQQQQPISPPLSGSSLSELHYKPVAPMTPSLTCMIFGDPHLRTFDSRYQTCSLLGARSLIEHPLFDVQITNTRLQDQFNATGVTKVIVQVRNFAPCAIATDLLYETDSLTQDLPSSTFTDGSREHPTSAGLIRISTSSESLGLVVTIHLDHLGVRIYVSQFTHTKFINVVIKFRTATSAAVKQKLVLEAISPISLCKAGCGQRELVDVEGTLKAAGIETKGGGKGAKGPVPQRVDGDADGYDEEDSGDKSVNEAGDEGDEEEEEEVFTGKVTGTVAEDEEAEEDDDEDDDEYYDDPSSKDEEASDYSEQLMPQKDPRAKRVKKETIGETEPNGGSQRRNNKNRRREGRRNNRNNNRNKSQKKAKADDSKRYLESSPSALLPPVPLHLLHLQPPPPPPPPQLSSVISSSSSSEVQSLSPPSSPGELPPPPLFPSNSNSNSKPYQSKPSSLTEECHEMMPFYRLACLYDTVLKGIVSNYPHKFALSFDEPRLPAEFYSSSAGTGSGSSGGDGGGSSAISRSSSPSAVGGAGSSPSSAVPVTGAGVVITPVLLGVITTLLLTQL